MPFFLMRCVHNPGQGDLRTAVRPDHRAWVGSGGQGLASVLIGSPLLGDDGAPVGHFGIIEAPTAEAAHAFAAGDPYNTSGVVARIELTPLPDTFQAERITDRMS